MRQVQKRGNGPERSGTARRRGTAERSGRLDPTVDLDWLIETTSILAAGETCLVTRLTSWSLDAYQDWLATTLARLAWLREA